MATALVARLEQDEDDLGPEAGSAGQRRTPPPVVLSPDGKACSLTRSRRAAAGGGPDAARRAGDGPRPGATPLLYTDGLVNDATATSTRARPSCWRCSAWCADLSLDDLCDEVLERLFLPDAQDDVAMLALRLHPQNRPRPPDAGPQVVPASIEPTPDVLPEAGMDA